MRRLSPLFAFALLALAACKGNEEKAGAAAPSASAPAPTATAAPKPEEPTLTLTAKAPAVGDKMEEKETSEMKAQLTMALGGKDKTFDVSETETTVKKTEVLAVDGKAITKAKVTYVEKKKTAIEDGKEKKKPKSAIEGKTFILEMKDGKLAITDEKGKRASLGEDAALRKENGRFGTPDPLLAAAPTKPMKVGDKSDALATAMADFFKGRDTGKEAPEVSDVEVKLIGIEKPGPDAVGVFAVTFTVASPKTTKEPFTMKATVKGTMKLRAKDAWPTAVAFAGPLTMESVDPKLKMSAKGDIKMGVEFTY